MTAARNRPGLPQLPSEFLAFTPTTRAAITRYAMRAVDEALAALTGVPAWELRLQGAEAFAEVYGAQDDWRTEAAAWLRRKADEQERTNREFPKHVEAYPSWTDRPRQFRWLADDLDAESKLAALTPSPATSAQGADAQAAERAALATPPAPALPPVARVPLTQERILELWGDRSDGPPTHQIISFARAVEASTGEQSHG